MPLTAQQFAPIWERYRFNFMRYLTAITRQAERQTMERLTERGYSRLTMNFSAPMSLLGARPLRLTELAAALGASKQLCLQSLKPLEQAGYIRRLPDPDDKRAKLVALTVEGEKLIEHALEEMQAIHQHYESLLGPAKVKALDACLREASKCLKVPGEGIRAGRDLPVSARLTPLTRTLTERLMAITADLGHPLQLSFGQVLTAIDLGGTSVATLAQLNGVTTQAISRIAGELERLDYIQRTTSASDRRSRHLCFTGKGLELIRDSVGSVQSLELELSGAMGKKMLLEMEALFRQLYLALDLEKGILKDFNPEAAHHLFGETSPHHRAGFDSPALLLYVASLLDPDLLRHKGAQVQFKSSALQPHAASDLEHIDQQLDPTQKSRLENLLRALRSRQ